MCYISKFSSMCLFSVAEWNCQGKMFVFHTPAVNDQFSTNHNSLTPLGFIIKSLLCDPVYSAHTGIWQPSRQTVQKLLVLQRNFTNDGWAPPTAPEIATPGKKRGNCSRKHKVTLTRNRCCSWCEAASCYPSPSTEKLHAGASPLH